MIFDLYPPSIRVHHDGPRSVEVLEENLPRLGRIHSQHVEGALARVDVVEVLGGPVQGEAFHPLVLGG